MPFTLPQQVLPDTDAVALRDALLTAYPLPAPTPPPPSPAPYRLGFAKQMLESPSLWTDLETQAKNLDILVMQHWQTGFLKRAKAANPNVRVYAYQNLTNSRPGTASQCSCGLDLTTAQKLGFSTGQVNSFGIVLNDITKSGYADAWCAAVKGRLAGLGFDGLYLDDFNFEPSVFPTGVSSTNWKLAFTSLAQSVRAAFPGPLLANMNGTWGQHPGITPLLDSLDGGFDEFSITWPAGNTVSQSFIDNALQAMDAARQRGKSYIANTVVLSVTDTKRALAGYCLALVGGASHYSLVVNYAGGYGTGTLDLPEFHRDIGQPLSPFTKSGSVYSRRFEGATVTVDVASLTGTIA